MAKPSTVPTVSVIPNPFHALDANGVPQSVVGTAGTRRYVGARIDEELSEATGKTRFFYPEFPERKYELVLDALVANAIREGALLVTDVESARKVGISEEDFLEVEAVLESEREKALASFVALVGEGATIEDVPTRRERDRREEAAAKTAVEAKASAGGSASPKGDVPATTTPTPPNALVELNRQRGPRVLSGTPDAPHVVIAPSAEKE